MRSNARSLRDIILQAGPELEGNNISDYSKVCTLRNWAASVIDVADYDLLLDIRLKDWYTLSAYQIYQLFNNNEGGVWCAGAAVFLKRVFEEFGFEAYYWDYGHVLAFTHAITLVNVKYNATKILVIQDAFTNTTYESPEGKALDFFTMLHLLKERRDSEIRIVEPAQPLWRDCHRLVGKNQKITKRLEFTLETFFLDRPWIIPASYDFLKKRGLPANFIYLHLFP